MGWSSVDGEGWTLVGNREIPGLPETLLGGVIAVGGDEESESTSFQALEARVSHLSVEEPAAFVRGDCSGDGDKPDLSDAIFLLGFNFLGTAEPPCLAACDANGDGDTGAVTDAVYLLGHLFLGSAPPVPPFPDCGPSELNTDSALGCETPLEACQ